MLSPDQSIGLMPWVLPTFEHPSQHHPEGFGVQRNGHDINTTDNALYATRDDPFVGGGGQTDSQQSYEIIPLFLNTLPPS